MAARRSSRDDRRHRFRLARPLDSRSVAAPGLAVHHLSSKHLPLLPEVERLAQDGFGTGGALRNWSSYGEHVRLPASVPEWRRGLLCDPQTSGGLLIAVDAAHASSLVAHCRASGFGAATEIGELAVGEPEIRVV